jgi:hypothetical protein
MGPEEHIVDDMSDRSTASPVFDRHAAVERLCREAREHLRDGDGSMALTAYLEAWDLLPEPKGSWDASTIILSSVGDLLRSSGDLSDALDVLLRVKGRTAGLFRSP